METHVKSKLIGRSIVSLTVILLLTSCVKTPDNDLDKSSLQSIVKLAHQGSAGAEAELARRYFNGIGVPQNFKLAAAWWEKSAKQGNVSAEHFLGTAYFRGQGIPQSYTLATQWWRKAAEHEDSAAEYDMGLANYESEGVPQNFERAAYWWTKAAKQGNAAADYALGISYQYGRGAPQNYALAYFFYHLASNGNARRGLKHETQLGEIMSAEEFKTAEKYVKYWKVGAPLPQLSHLAVAIVGAWVCTSNRGERIIDRYSSDGRLSMQIPGNPNGSTPISRAGLDVDFNYHVDDDVLAITSTDTIITFSPQDLGVIPGLIQGGATLYGVNSIRLVEPGHPGWIGSATLNGTQLNVHWNTDVKPNGDRSSMDVTDSCIKRNSGQSRRGDATAMTAPPAFSPPVASGGSVNPVPRSNSTATPTGGGAMSAINAVRAFYGALSRGDGAKANMLVIPQKRALPAYQRNSITAFYGHMAEPLILLSVTPTGASEYEVHYQYRKRMAQCNDRAIVMTQQYNGRVFISRIRPLGNC